MEDLTFRWGPAFRETPPYRGAKVARYYRAESRSGDVVLPISVELGRPEHHEFRWIDHASARDLVGPRARGQIIGSHCPGALTHEGGSQQIGKRSLETQQLLLGLDAHSPRESTQVVGAEHPVAGDNDGNRITATSLSDILR